MEIIGTIVIGLLVGIVAKLLMPGKDPDGFIITILHEGRGHIYTRTMKEGHCRL